MRTNIVVLRPDEPSQGAEVELADAPSIDELHRVLDPLLRTNNFEHVRVYVGAEPWLGVSAYRDMFVDETSALYDLPRNEAATELYRRNWMMHEADRMTAADVDSLPAIYGPAVFFPDRVVWS